MLRYWLSACCEGPSCGVVQVGDKTVDYNESFRLYLARGSFRTSTPPTLHLLLLLCASV